MSVFNVPTSSALNVNSSEFSLTVTPGHPSGTFGFRTLKCPHALVHLSNLKGARSLSFFMNSLKPSVRLFLPPLTEVCHDVLYEAVPIFLLVCQQLQRIDKICAQALRYCTRSEDLGLIDTFTCLYDQKPVRLLPIVFLSTDRAPPIVAHFLPETHQM